MKKIKDMNFKLNIKSVLLFEQLTGKSFYEITDNDLEDLIYAIIIVNNPDMRITKSQLEFIMENNQKMAKELVQDLSDELQYISSFEFAKTPKEIQRKEKKDEKEEVADISSVIGMLIVEYGLDAHYVMYEMSLWEISIYAQAIEQYRREEMTNQRFWTYLNILPHIDGKKISGPEKLVPFPWEKTAKDDAKKFMNDNTDAINNFFKNQNKDE